MNKPIVYFKTLDAHFYEQVKNFHNSTIYHSPEWHQTLKKTFGWKISAIVSIDKKNNIQWYLPFVRKRRMLLKHVSVALPLSHQIGIAVNPNCIFSKDFNPNIIPHKLLPLEVHDNLNIIKADKIRQYDTTMLSLNTHSTESALFKSFDSKSIRYMIRRALREEIEIVNGCDDKRIHDFITLMEQTRHRQGSPMYPKRFFYNLRDSFSGSSSLSIFVAYLNDVPISSAGFFHMKEFSVYAYSASVSDKKIKRKGANELVMWRAIQQAYQMGKQYMDFGTSSCSLPGLRHYKEKWGGVSHELPYTFLTSSRTKGDVKRVSIDRESSMVKMASNLFRAMPRSVFTTLSPIALRMAL